MESWSPETICAVLDEVAERHAVDRDRVYLTGYSMGGWGTWETAMAAPERFAAIVPLCGRVIPLLAFRIWQMPVWAFHGDADDVVPISHSREMVETLRGMGNDKVRFTIYAGAGHEIWGRTYSSPELYAWLLEQRRPNREEAGSEPATRQATGVKVGEVTSTSAVVWMRVTKHSMRNQDGIAFKGREATALEPGTSVESLEGACPGALGRVRLRYGTEEDLSDAADTGWQEVTAQSDYSHQFALTELRPGATYYYSAEAAPAGGGPAHEPLCGQFGTPKAPDKPMPVTFTVVTGQGYRDLDHPDGYEIYESMARLEPDFSVATGDNVYYDNDPPRATSVELARYHWHRMHSLPRHVQFHLQVPGYWEKDDHDAYANDCWPGGEVAAMLPFTFAEGLRLFREQVPVGERTYRTFRWGEYLQIWLPEGRDFRSPNDMPDGPGKTIWGAEQKTWLKQSLLASDAACKILVSPTPIVGPDRATKADNHANVAFGHEGNEFRAWAKEHLPTGFFVVCGDRHWQYHSVDPATGLDEFSCGPASDQHAGGSPGESKEYHRFHRVKGGFLSVTLLQAPHVNGPQVRFRFHDVRGEVVYTYSVSIPRP
jgi:alkaline phosphatase D